MMVTEGSFIYPKRSPSQREYARGYWLAAHFPETPTDVSHLFAAGPEYVNDSSSNKPGPFQKVFPTVADEKTAEAIFLGLSNG